MMKGSHGLSAGILDNGALRSFEVDPVRISLKEATPYSKLSANIYLRKRANPLEYTALIGPESNSRFEIYENAFVAKGSWSGLKYCCSLQFSSSSSTWQWQVDIRNENQQIVELDLIYLQDIGLKPVNESSVNEYYVAQYVERLILEDQKYGSVVCCRQNMRGPTGNPWVMLASKNYALYASTDGMQFFGKSYKETGIPEGLVCDTLGGEYAGESSIVALQEKPFRLQPESTHTSTFIGNYISDHPQATSADDLIHLPELFSEFERGTEIGAMIKQFSPLRNIFNTSPFLPADDLNSEELKRFFGENWRHIEEDNGRVISFFYNKNSHVVLRPKEKLVDRPHGHIMQAKAGLVPDENIVSTTAYAYGVFNSHLTQGNTNFNIFLSVSSSQFNLNTGTGQRIFVEIDGQKYLLGVPSAFDMGLNYCRWIYKHGDFCMQVRTWTSKTAPQVNLDIELLSGNKANLLITNHFDENNSWKIDYGDLLGEYLAKPDPKSLIAGKYTNPQFKIFIQDSDSKYTVYNQETDGSNLFIIDVQQATSFCLSFIGEICESTNIIIFDNPEKQWLEDYNDAQKMWSDFSLNLFLHGENKDAAAIQETLPWFGMNALTHFLTPYGLEQFSGAAWGTRDVSQGPIDLLLNLGKFDEAKIVLLKIFSNQNPDGGWPQWWMFDSYTNIRAHEAHGDIIYWCIIALANYIEITGDITILDSILPYYHEKGTGFAEKTPLSEHVERLIQLITSSFIKGTSLVPFGGGDWNDSLQPVSRDLAQRMISSWTVEMNYQAFTQYQKVYRLTGNARKADGLKKICNNIKDDFNKYLIKDGLVAGYGLVEDDDTISVLLHPSDQITGIHYSILPMNRGIISGIFTREQALSHQDVVEKHLKGPDGARLMDRPIKYKGGIQFIFQRAESSTFFGREIGLMYVHEHIRYAESLAIMGKADAFVYALRQAIPVEYRDFVEQGDIRQSNCYYSSSDVIFRNRYDADEHYDEVKTGGYQLKGGWRVYSSGPGIFIGLIISRLLGLRIESGKVIVDPVMPFSFDNLAISLNFLGYPLTLKYRVTETQFSPKSITINGERVKFEYEDNAYRKGGAVILKEQFLSLISQKENIVEIIL